MEGRAFASGRTRRLMKTAPPVPVRAAAFGLSYRAAGDSDRDLLARIYTSTRADEVARTGWPAEQQRQFLQMQFDAQDAHYRKHYPDALWLVIQLGAAPVGRLYLEDRERELRILDIALLSEFRGRGWGEAVLRDLMDGAAETGRGVSIHVEKTNPAMRLYLRLGFVRIEQQGVYDLMEWIPSEKDRRQADRAEQTDHR